MAGPESEKQTPFFRVWVTTDDYLVIEMVDSEADVEAYRRTKKIVRLEEGTIQAVPLSELKTGLTGQPYRKIWD